MKQMLQQAQAMQKKMADIQKRVEESEFVGDAAGGAVKVTVSGKGEMKKCEIVELSLLDAEEKETLEDLIVAAYTKAKEESDSKLSEEMKNAGISPDALKGFGI